MGANPELDDWSPARILREGVAVTGAELERENIPLSLFCVRIAGTRQHLLRDRTGSGTRSSRRAPTQVIPQVRNLVAVPGLIMLLTGCTAVPMQPTVEGNSSLDPSVLAQVEMQIDQYRDGVLSVFPDAELPQVEIVRLVTAEEWPKIVATCTTEAGFRAEASADGGVSMEVEDPAQEEAMWVANYVCKAQYPIDPKYQEPLDQAQIDWVYRYYVDELSPCIESYNFPVDDPPSETVFRQNLGSDRSWHPYDHVTHVGDELLTELLTTCPQEPPHSFQ